MSKRALTPTSGVPIAGPTVDGALDDLKRVLEGAVDAAILARTLLVILLGESHFARPFAQSPHARQPEPERKRGTKER